MNRFIAVALSMIPAAAMAAQEPAANAARRAAPLVELAGCRAIAADTERLACFDRAAQRLDDSERRGDVIVADRATVQQSRKAQFGRSSTSFDPFQTARTAGAPEIRQVEGTLRSAVYTNRAWTFVLADGSRWRQVDVRVVNPPRAGAKVVVRRAALASFLLKVGNDSPVRVQRVD